MKKITFITMQLRTPGGIERFVSTLATMFSDNYNVEIITNYGKPSTALAFPLSKNVKVTFLQPTQPKEISMKNLIAHFMWHKIPAELKRRHKINHTRIKAFRSYLKNLDTDYIITDRALYSKLTGKYYHGNAKKIATDHNYHQNNHKYIKTLRNSLKNFDVLVVATKELQTFYQKIFSNIKCYNIPNPLNQIPTKKSPLNTQNLLAIGRFVPEKDFLSLVDVMNLVHQENPEIKLTIIGDGQEMPLIKSKIKSSGLENIISLPGWLSPDKIEKYYYNSSLYVMTSKTEAFGLVLTEAMSFGLPCIAFDRASGARSLISAQTGVLISNADTGMMAKKIVELLRSPNKLKTYQHNINQIIQDYSQESVKSHWAKIIN